MYLSDFEILTPPFSYSQREGLAALARLHIHSDGEKKLVEERIAKVCCKEDKIASRNTSIEEGWLETPRDFGDRSRYYQKAVEEALTQFYPEGSTAPEEMIHVTCTGYNSPSAAQKIVLKRGWTKKTQVTHAYHMGCMAAVPAIRMACGFAASGKKRIDIVHSELSSLHLNPALHTDEQLVAQSLFADGLIKYSLKPTPEKRAQFRVVSIYEEIIPDTDELMKWECESWGLKMTLKKEIPVWIARSIEDFRRTLEEKSGLALQNSYYAIHPGGPKIIEWVAKKLNLTREQIAHSEKILLNYGNMSSATLPHVLEAMLKDSSIPSGSSIVGLAFGPGICMCGIVLEKVVL